MEGPQSLPEKPKSNLEFFIIDYLTHLENKKSFVAGDSVFRTQGSHAHKELVVTKIDDDGITEVLPVPDTPTFNTSPLKIPSRELYHYDDYQNAFGYALAEDQHDARERRPS